MAMADLYEIIAALREGRMVVLMDDEDRENEGDFLMAACHADPSSINRMAAEGRGLICVPMDRSWSTRLGLNVLGPDGHRIEGTSIERGTDGPVPPLQGTAFTQSVDLVRGTSTGISAYDRAATIRALADPNAAGGDFASPGHVFPLVSVPGGLRRRRGHTEAAVDLCKAAGLPPVGVICEILNPDGTMARFPQLKEYASRTGILISSIESLLNEGLAELVEKAETIQESYRYEGAPL